MTGGNPFARILEAHANRPPEERTQAITAAIGETIPFVKTAGLQIEAYTPTRVIVRLDQRNAVQNHIGGLHAAAMALVAETATGLVVALNVPDASVPVIRTLHVDFRRRTDPPLRATATLSDDEAARIRSRPIGKIDVPITVADATGDAPIETTLEWAWLPARRVLGDET